MKKHLFIILNIICFLTAIPPLVHAQVVGPFNLYVSEQGGNPDPIYDGSYQASADEGRTVNIQIFNILGPITVAPMNFMLVGPPCPTYDDHGNRIPANPLPPNTQLMDGDVSIDPANIPAAGTTVNAEFTGQDVGFWTHCATGVQVPENAQRTAKFNIVSIKMVLADANATICSAGPVVENVQSLYPNNLGNVTWASQNGKFTVVGDNTKATMTGVADGADVLIGTFTVNGAVYKVRMPVQVNFIKFTDPRTVYAWYPGGNEDATLLLTPQSNNNNLTWGLTLNGGAGTATINANTGAITYPNAPGGTYRLTATSNNDNTCKATTSVVFMGYDILVNNTKNASACDGTQNIAVKVVPIPSTLPVAELAKFGGITVSSETRDVDNGNEEGTDVLDIPALDGNFRTVIRKAIWYSTVNCNRFSVHKIIGTAVVNGVNVNTPLPGRTDATLTSRIDCINGFANVINAWAGMPQVVFGPSPLIPGAVRAVIGGQGSFRRNVIAQAVWWAPAQSQFKSFVMDEENFHKTQQLENPNHVMMVDLFDPNRVMAQAYQLWWDGPNAAYSQAMVLQGFVVLSNAEWMRSTSFFQYPSPRRCFIEAEAKQNTGIQFGFHMTCAYPLCP